MYHNMETVSENFILWSICLSVIVIFILKWLMSRKKFYDVASKFECPPGFSCYPLIGHAHHYANLEDIITIATSFKTPCGVVYLGTRVLYFLNDVNLLEDLLNNDKCLDKPHYFDIMKHVEGGLFMASNKKNIWRLQRKLLNPGFKQRILNFYSDKFTKHDERFVNSLDEKVGDHFDILGDALKLNFMKFFDCAVGLDFSEKSNEFLDALVASVALANARFFSLVGNVKILNKIFKNTKEFDESLKTLRQITSEIVVERQKFLEEKNDSIPPEAVEDDEYEELIFIDYLLQCVKENKYDEKNLVPELITFIYAGIDTCSTVFSLLCVCLGMYPEVQEKLYQEIINVLGNRPYHYTDYPRFKYLHMVIKETMRLFPPAPVLHRESTEDVKIGDYNFPKNSIFQVNIINIHRSSKYYENPLTFNPERFAPDSEEAQSRHRFAYLPFSGGKRNCIGERFGLMSLASSVATVLQKYRFETTYKSIKDIRLEQKFTINAIEGYPVKIYLRD